MTDDFSFSFDKHRFISENDADIRLRFSKNIARGTQHTRGLLS